MAVGVGQITDLIDHQESGGGVVAQAAAQSGVAVEGREIAQQFAGTGKQHGMAVEDRLMGDVLGEHGLADAIGSDQNGVAGVLEEVECHQGLDGGAVAAFRPSPVEIAQRFEAADMGAGQAPFQAAARPLLLLPIDHRLGPATGDGFLPMGQQTMEMERLGSGLQNVRIAHRASPSAGRRVRVHGCAR